MWPDRVSNPGTLIYQSDMLPTALRQFHKVAPHKLSDLVLYEGTTTLSIICTGYLFYMQIM